MKTPCTRCGNPVPVIDNIQWTQFWGAVRTTETTTVTRTAVVSGTQIKSPTSNRADDRILQAEEKADLCQDCWGKLLDWLKGRA